MIESFKHKGLRQYFEDDNPRGINPQHAEKIRLILGALHAADRLQGMDLPTFGLHELQGKRKGTWAVTVRANWRVTFRFKDGNAIDVNYEDYH
jgi:proteic killer suppression protein